MYLEVEQLRKKFDAEEVLRGLGLSLARNRTLSILGRSGSGKTTLFKVMAGLLTPDGGQIRLQGEVINDWPPQRRNIVYLYQEPLLFPHLSVFDNVAFGLQIRKRPRAEIRQRTEIMLQELGLQEHARKMPRQLSGGQRQRVAFGRALIINPRVLLLDEPFGALDSETRRQMQTLLKRVIAEFGITALFVTHDLKEALVMGDQIGLMQAGTLRLYPDRQAFLEDEHSGAAEEMAFWRDMDGKSNFP